MQSEGIAEADTVEAEAVEEDIVNRLNVTISMDYFGFNFCNGVVVTLVHINILYVGPLPPFFLCVPMGPILFIELDRVP